MAMNEICMYFKYQYRLDWIEIEIEIEMIHCS